MCLEGFGGVVGQCPLQGLLSEQTPGLVGFHACLPFQRADVRSETQAQPPCQAAPR